jgi:hypothetical protein
MMAGIRPGLLYGLLAFLAGAVLGVIRDLALAPSIGSVAAAILEAGVMAMLLWLAARYAIRFLPATARRESRAGMALAAVVLVLLGEIALGMGFEATGLAAQRPPRGGVEEAIGLALLGWLAAQPFRVRREG